ncbi:hypothetical protein BBO99_00002774 [Phytophthora kernoviae]|uniref:Uncharacterized protein n=2 Tax=Phytophthora kernoviae TaxID=325452 RepID=A0A3R7NJK4_9STRA|nr:hypothetical protein G195_003684 [Phytophthora kernoviae 00238/432]KAG2528289.1 hypothetical protein JM16_001312 [Phytophthora kernoviae]KAG2529495.1 hypothetical protein JM18_002751 [Phytophthora kernoviae]RLN02060.1 hypothetical protein BBI17_003548 [Phytophthora kernoviae]RLN82633.1 hypothetical protein BBO99_00002774 [Phytophthora kernoviae]
MDKSQLSWDKCHERAERQLQLRKQGGREWIIPEVADAVQRQSSAEVDEEIISLQELLTLLVHAFALSSGAPLEDFTVQMVQKVIADKILQECAQQFAEISDDKFTPTDIEPPRSLIAKLCSSIVNPSGAPISELEHIVDASEQLTRAGIDLLKSGFSKFGFGGGSGGGQRGTNVNRVLGESNILLVFVVGGITFDEIQEVHDALSDNSKYQIILGGTTITNNEVILKKLFS